MVALNHEAVLVSGVVSGDDNAFRGGVGVAACYRLAKLLGSKLLGAANSTNCNPVFGLETGDK